jgi:predicted anti-sigma-YlaC factor YlaD
MIDCREAARLQGQFLALDLAPEKENEVRQHLERCVPCREAVERREPALALASRLADLPPVEDESFVAEVLAGIHQRQLERRLQRRRRGWMAAAAALLLAVLGGYTALRHPTPERPALVAVRPAVGVRAQSGEPAFVEVEGEGVRLYQLTPPTKDAVQVAFIVDPRLDL